MPTRKSKRARFVPQLILGSAAAVSVIPAVALVDCGGEVSSPAQSFTVAAVALAFDDGDAPDAADAPDAGQFTVASVAAIFEDSGTDASLYAVADATFFGVATDAGGTDDDADNLDGAKSDGSHDSGEG